jgi:Ca-activated chloride channel family protein
MTAIVFPFEFSYPWAFGLLLLIPIWTMVQRKKIFISLSWPHYSVFSRTLSWRVRGLRLLPILRALSFLALTIALARPQKYFEREEITSEGIDIVLVLDISGSMLARDFEPNRLEVAKQVAINFVEKRRFDRMGLVLFSGESFTQVPLTLDHNLLKQSILATEIGIIKDGTAIGMGLANAVNRLNETESPTKVVILLTDGVNNAGYINPNTAMELAKKMGVKVYTIGVGSIGEAPMPVSRRRDGSFVYNLVKVEIDEDLLKQIAELTGGRYFRATSEEMLTYIYSEIDSMEKTEIEVSVIQEVKEYYPPFVLFGLLLIVLEMILSFVVFKRLDI